MILLTLTTCLMVAVVGYLFGLNRALAKLVRVQERQYHRESRRSAHLLDRLLMKNGFTPLSEPVVRKESAAILTMPVADPFEAAEIEWEKEDVGSYLAMSAAMSAEERRELITEARKRVG